ncbi:Glycosyltransferase involved in cell wall bisynthesis [Roseovarius litoreus]|uniref:Glycosyltransferase involved in cell wall bisynthesis n=1 Tax=Roseovarius litoreus TaxID=1155722 RepID=A0A1M7K936_9RHOB|nr:glycosyltransferase family 4 protein [Roseovarius litoreus]SHM61725.1 Glycosyltransferase involved in cell wall bisynthesis [Roseovarius litoreus]
MASQFSKKILICAPNATARFGGEAILPLKYFELLRKRDVDVRLIAHARNQRDLEERVGDDADRIMYVPDSKWHRMIWKAGKPFPHAIQDAVFGSMMAWIDQRYQTKFIRECVRAGLVDIIHQPIPVSPLAPSWIYGFAVPVVIGPMNGGMNFPKGYEEYESLFARNFVFGARLVALALNRVIPGKKHAAALLVANERTRMALPFPNHPNIVQLVENGVDLDLWQPSERVIRKPNEPFRLVFVGRLVDLKALDFTLSAVAQAQARGVDVYLDIVGDGPELTRLRGLSKELGIDDLIEFRGFLSQSQCAEILKESDALILNCVRECGGAVVLEAMSAGLPVIGPEWGGPADYINEECGILVHPEPKDTYAARICDAIFELATNPSKCSEMGKQGRRRIVNDFDWEKKIDTMMDVYRTVQ